MSDVEVSVTGSEPRLDLAAADQFGGVVWHGPPRTRYDDTGPAAREGEHAIGGVMDAFQGPYVVAADWNSRVIPERLAKAHDARLVGGRIDALIAAGLKVLDHDYVQVVGGVRLGTDHEWGALRVRVKRADRRLARTRTVWFYNIRVGRDGRQVQRELDAMMAAPGTIAVMLCEAGGYVFGRRQGFELVRDRSSESRANVAAYVRRGHVRYARFVDLRATWRKTEHAGQHAPRSFLVLIIGWRATRPARKWKRGK